MSINQTAFEGYWKRSRDKITVWWDKFSDNDVDQIAGRYERLISVLQTKYGFTRQLAELDIARYMLPHPPSSELAD